MKYAISIIVALVLALISVAAFATGNSNGCQGNCPQSGGTTTVNSDVRNTNTNVNTNVNTQGQRQGQLQGQQQGQGQLQGQSQTATGGNASNSGNAQSTTVTITEGDTPKQAASGPGIASSPSATCRIAVGVSVGGTFGGAGAFGSIEDERCADMERGRYMAEVLGRKDAAKALACKDEKMAEALGDCKPAKVAYKTVDGVTPVANTGRDPFRHSGE